MSDVSPPSAAAAKTVWTVLEVVKWTAARFTERGLGSPRLDAELLAAHAFGMSRVALYTQFDRPLEPTELARYRDLVKRRQAGESVAYITGRKEFWTLDLQIDRRVLVPRPDTETAVEAALALLPKDAADLRVADIGTGSGAIALALKKDRPLAMVVASDRSVDALAVARANAERLKLEVTFVEGDLAAPLAPFAPFDLVVANLPYVPTGDIPTLAPEVRQEPLLALDGGDDGLDLVRRLVRELPPLLGPDGTLLLEIGMGQAAATVEIFTRAGWRDPGTRRDLGGVERVVLARRPEGA